MTTLDNSGIQVTIRTRKGSDFGGLLRTVNAVTRTPYDLTGYTGTLRIYTESGTVAIPCTITGNEVSFNIDHAVTTSLPAQSKYALSITSPADRITCLIWGACLIQQDVAVA